MPEKSLLPFLILAFGFVWIGICEWLQRRASRRGSAEASTPTVPRLTLLGISGLLLCMIAAGVAAYAKWISR